MKRMWSKNELKKIISEVLSSGLTSDIRTTGDISANYLSGNAMQASKIYDLQKIVDNRDRVRFVEGDIDLREGVEHITKVYGKWTLSGSHLMIVLCIDLEIFNFTEQVSLSAIGLPLWIKDKLVPLFATVVERQTFLAFADDYSTQSISFYFTKDAQKNIGIVMSQANVDKVRHCRIAFDLIIDNDADPEQ